MGLEENADTGLDIEDLVNIHKGHIKDRYQVSHIINHLRTCPHLYVTDFVVGMMAIEWITNVLFLF